MKSFHCFYEHDANGKQGFTLIEVLIGLFLFTFGILAVMAMTITAMHGYIRSRISNTEVNRTTLNVEVLKHAGYTGKDKIFEGEEGDGNPLGSDGDAVGYAYENDAVVRGAKFITMQNDEIKGNGVGGVYEVYYLKPAIDD